MSSGLMNRLKWSGGICVNGLPQHTNYPVRPGDVITVLLDEPEPEYPAEDGELTVLYEDEGILVVDKPAGMLIHPSRATNQGTLANLVACYYRRTGQKSAFHPVTRLDGILGASPGRTNLQACAAPGGRPHPSAAGTLRLYGLPHSGRPAVRHGGILPIF